MTYQEDFHGTRDIHASGDCCTEVEEDTYGATQLGAEIPGNHVVRTAARDDPIRGNGRERYGREESLNSRRMEEWSYNAAADKYDAEALHDSCSSDDPRQTDEEDDAEDVLEARQVDPHEGAHLRQLNMTLFCF